MKIGLNEIWEFLDYASKSKSNWHFSLKAGGITIRNLRYKSLASLKNDKHYDPELINSLFIYREVLWQPLVNGSIAANLTPLRVFQNFCKEYSEQENIHPICKELLIGLSLLARKAVNRLSVANQAKEILTKENSQKSNVLPIDVSTSKVLGDFRKGCFPIILFFISHPLNRKDYQKDAWNRLNYSVKVQLTQYNNQYTDLDEPYWEILFEKTKIVQDQPNGS